MPVIPSLGAIVVSSFLQGTPDKPGQPSSPDCTDVSHIDLSDVSPASAPQWCITASEPITFVFDSPLKPGSVQVETGGDAPRIAQGDDLVTLYPSSALHPGERLKLTARFADDAAPAQVGFWLVGHPLKGARRVEVLRHPRSPEALQQALVKAQAEARQCQEEKTRLLTERLEPGGLLATAWLERDRLVRRKILAPPAQPPLGSSLSVIGFSSYSHDRSFAVRLDLVNQGTVPWTAAGAFLTERTGTETVLVLGPEPTFAPGSTGALVVGAETGSEPFQCPCTVKLWEASGARGLTVEDVTFPETK